MCRECKYISENKCILNDNRTLGVSYTTSRKTPKWCNIREKYIKYLEK